MSTPVIEGSSRRELVSELRRLVVVDRRYVLTGCDAAKPFLTEYRSATGEAVAVDPGSLVELQ